MHCRIQVGDDPEVFDFRFGRNLVEEYRGSCEQELNGVVGRRSGK